jgi:Uma2 family endonuclease
MSTLPRYTSRDLECLPDIDGVRYEIIDGDLYVSKQPSWEHQVVCLAIGTELRLWDRRAGLGQASGAPGLIFSPENDVAPDIVWISRQRLEGRLDAAGHLRTAPELVIEVLSPGRRNEQRDREVKLTLYSRQGVLEYWIVDWQQRTVQVYRRVEQALALVATLVGEDALTSPLLPDFHCPLATLWD